MNLNIYESELNPLILKENKLIIFGAGVNGAAFRERLFTYNIDIEIIAVADSDPKKHGNCFIDKTVISPNELENFDKEIPVVVTPFSGGFEIKELLNTLGFYNLYFYSHVYAWFFGVMQSVRTNAYNENKDLINKVLTENTEKINFVRENFADERSKLVFDAHLKAKYF
ncbi:MAG: hypothetical protein LBM93_15510, partial [Oscillospiraceae bacterium]|nr:hypothetical protein [Oscillospiraceae bacterium]